MRIRLFLRLGAGAAMALWALGAHAISCDIVVDRSGAVVYQDVKPPVDMSDKGAVARERMRQRGEQLMIVEVDSCPRLVFSPVDGMASVDEIVAGMRPYVAVTGGMGSSARPGASGTIAAAPSAPSPPAPARSSSSGRSY